MRFGGERHPLFEKGLQEFRAGRPFEAHEDWERLWDESAGNDRVFLQGLIQLAAACVHVGRGNPAPARRLFGLALAKLESIPEGFAPIPIEPLRRDLRSALDADDLMPVHLETLFRL